MTLLGAGAVGKSSTTIRFVCDEFRQMWDPTIEDDYRTIINVDGKHQGLDILDTAGQEQFSPLQAHWVREADAFMVMYAIENERTFKHVNKIMQTLWRWRDGERIDLILVGNKMDLPTSERQVTYKMGKELADTWGKPFIEISAKTGENVREAFEILVKEVKRPERIYTTDPPKSSGCSVM